MTDEEIRMRYRFTHHALVELYKLCRTLGNFKNGVEHNGIDEGEVYASGVFDHIEAVLRGDNNEPDPPRFYMDHGTIHDRVTGKHVVTDGQPPFEDSVEQVCNLLNSICAPTPYRCDLCGFGECLATTANCPRLVGATALSSHDGGQP